MIHPTTSSSESNKATRSNTKKNASIMSKEYRHRNIQILKSSLFPKNKTKAINQIAVLLFQYRCTIINWPKLEINTRYKYKSTSFEMQKILSHPNSISSTWVIHWHICKHFIIPVPEQLWKHKPNPIIEDEHIVLTHDKMILLSCRVRWQGRPQDGAVGPSPTEHGNWEVVTPDNSGVDG